MTDRDRDRVCRDYLIALDVGDCDALERLWTLAGLHPELEADFHELNAELDRLAIVDHLARDRTTVAEAVQTHLTTAEIVVPAVGPITLADVAEELHRHTPDKLPADDHLLNAKLRSATDVIPSDLNLPAFIRWVESLYGTASRRYWKSLYDAVVALDMRRQAEGYQMAARRAPKPEGPK